MKMKILFTKDEMNLICKYLKNITNNLNGNGKGKIYGEYWRFRIALSNSKENTELNFTKDEMSFMCTLLFDAKGKKMNEIFMKIAETMQGSVELNGCQPDNDYGLDDSYLW